MDMVENNDDLRTSSKDKDDEKSQKSRKRSQTPVTRMRERLLREPMPTYADRRYTGMFRFVVKRPASYGDPLALLKRLPQRHAQVIDARRRMFTYHASGEGVPGTVNAQVQEIEGIFHAEFLIAKELCEYLGYTERWKEFACLQEGIINNNDPWEFFLE